ncbi:hypothetical protein Tco_0425040 [Tanacetum coccineum]
MIKVVFIALESIVRSRLGHSNSSTLFGGVTKGKEKMTEPEKHLKKKDQVLFDEQEAIRLQAQFDEEARDKVETDYELAQRLQQKEQEELTIEEKSKLFAAKRAEERGTDHQLKLNKEV